MAQLRGPGISGLKTQRTEKSVKRREREKKGGGHETESLHGVPLEKIFEYDYTARVNRPVRKRAASYTRNAFARAPPGGGGAVGGPRAPPPGKGEEIPVPREKERRG